VSLGGQHLAARRCIEENPENGFLRHESPGEPSMPLGGF